MATYEYEPHNEPRRKGAVLAWIMLITWIAVIWGHSLMPGAESDVQSYYVVDLLQKFAGYIATTKEGFFWRIVNEHPSIVRILSDPALANHYVRKAAHFAEYFVLGMLAFRAVRRAPRSAFLGTLLYGIMWVGVPMADEYIQTQVPYRSGQMSDVLLDMTGFGTAAAICVVLALIAMILGAIFRPRRTREAW